MSCTPHWSPQAAFVDMNSEMVLLYCVISVWDADWCIAISRGQQERDHDTDSEVSAVHWKFIKLSRPIQRHTRTHACMHTHLDTRTDAHTQRHKRTHTHIWPLFAPVFCLLAVYLLFVFRASVTCSDMCCYPLFTWMEYITLPQLGTKDAEVRSPVLKIQSYKRFRPFSLQSVRR